jgi:hypothetical protein
LHLVLPKRRRTHVFCKSPLWSVSGRHLRALMPAPPGQCSRECFVSSARLFIVDTPLQTFSSMLIVTIRSIYQEIHNEGKRFNHQQWFMSNHSTSTCVDFLFLLAWYLFRVETCGKMLADQCWPLNPDFVPYVTCGS